jgi:hypothetical protein
MCGLQRKSNSSEVFEFFYIAHQLDGENAPTSYITHLTETGYRELRPNTEVITGAITVPIWRQKCYYSDRLMCLVLNSLVYWCRCLWRRVRRTSLVYLI